MLGERKLRLAANTNDLDRLKTLLDSCCLQRLHRSCEVLDISFTFIKIHLLTLFYFSTGFCYITVLIPIKLIHSEIHLCI